MENPGSKLRELVQETRNLLLELSDSSSSERPAPGKWSAKEILGHLIDSCINNHIRFVKAQFQDDLNFEGYAQEKWVAVQGYQERHWTELINIWFLYNLNLAEVIERIPDDVLRQSRTYHTLDKMGWKVVASDQTTTLHYLILDYMGHLEHHMQQMIPAYSPTIIGTY